MDKYHIGHVWIFGTKQFISFGNLSINVSRSKFWTKLRAI
eukprot:08237.XXX_94220_94336_1 [CDS] Oithona nana genome sequencing.